MMSMVQDEWYNEDQCDCHLQYKKIFFFFEGYQNAIKNKNKLIVICESCISQICGHQKIPYES